MGTTPTTQVRAATRADATTIRHLRLRMLTEAPDAYNTDPTHAHTEPLEHWERWVGVDPDGTRRGVQLADSGDQPVGMVAAHITPTAPDGTRVAHIGAMWVEPHARRDGTARALLAAIEAWAWAEGATDAHLGVATTNTQARLLYETAGYTPTGESVPTRSGGTEAMFTKHRP